MMKNTGKFVTTVLLLLLVLALVLSGCANGSKQSGGDGEEPKTIKVGKINKDMKYYAEIKMRASSGFAGGKIEVELDPSQAPITVQNFVDLVEKGFYDGIKFHRIEPGFVIQGGCPLGTGTGGPGYKIQGEFKANGIENNIKHERGVISMARAKDYNSGGSQFFIVLETSASITRSLDGLYASFGRVISGLDVVDAIAKLPNSATTIDKVRMIEKP